MSESIPVKPRSASSRSFSVSKSPSEPEVGSQKIKRPKTLRTAKVDKHQIDSSPTDKFSTDKLDNISIGSNESSSEVPRDEQTFGARRLNSSGSLASSSASKPALTSSAEFTNHAVQKMNLAAGRRGSVARNRHASSPKEQPTEYFDSELVAAFEAVLLTPNSTGVLSDMSKEDWYNLMSKETVRVSNKMKGKRKTAKSTFDEPQLPKPSPDSSSLPALSNSPSSPRSLKLSSSDSPTQSHLDNKENELKDTPLTSDAASDQLTALYDEAAKNWQNLDLAKKERRIRSFMAKYEHIRAHLDEHVWEAIPDQTIFSDYPIVTSTDPNDQYLINPQDDSTLVEFGDDSTTYEKQLALLHVEQKNIEINYYTDWFSNDEHRNWIGEDKDVGPVIVSIQLQRKDKNGNVNANSRVFIRTKDQDEWLFLPSRLKSGEILAALKKEKPWLAKVKLEKVKTDKICPHLVQLESTLGFKTNIKVGVLPVKAGQTDENQMFSNQTVSPAYEEFLEFIGDSIELQGWTGYNGGLDTSQNTTGTHSRYREFEGYKIMYHVSTLLPFTPGDDQQVERKRHLGNDVVTIIWLDDGAHSFNPHCITTHFTYIFVVVSLDKQKTEETGETHYRLAVASKEGTRPFGPRLPSPAVFKKDATFLSFLMTKIVNSERAAFEAPSFKLKMRRTRAQILDELIKSFK